jgi:hypothetical protein
MLRRILTFLEKRLGFDFPPPVSAEEHIEDQNRLIRQIAASLSGHNVILEEDIEKLRKKVQAHDFLAYP